MSIEITIETSAEQGREFWADMGPFFASRALAKELGGPLYDEEGMIWVIARDEDKIVGWAAGIVKEGRGVLEWSWVQEEYRRRGIWKRMHKVRVKHLKEAGAVSVKTSTREPGMVQALEAEGLKKVGTRGSWVQLEQAL